jgi:hypothetical protein
MTAQPHPPLCHRPVLLPLIALGLALPAALSWSASAEAQRGRRWGARGGVAIQPAQPQAQVQVQVQAQPMPPPQPVPQSQVQVQVQPALHGHAHTQVQVQPAPQAQWQVQGGAGVAVVGAPVGRRPPPSVRVMTPPPPPRQTRWMPPPQQGGQWIEGHWSWNGGQWVWFDGRWEVPPQQGVVWVPPRFEGGLWVAGYWAQPQTTLPPAQRHYAVGAYVSAYLGMNDTRDATGRPYHDYVLDLRAGETVAFVVAGGPADAPSGQRVWPTLQIYGRRGLLAQDVPTVGLQDAMLVFTSPRSERYTIRISTRQGTAATGTYVLESGAGQWAPPVSPYQQFWGGGAVAADVQLQAGPHQVWVQQPGGQQVVVQPGGQQVWVQQPGAQVQVGAAPMDCRNTLLAMGHAPAHAIHCEGAEPTCADALLRAGHSPASLIHCQGVQPACAVATLRAGNSPAQLIHCR